MPEGPSLVIIAKELKDFKKQKILAVSGNTKVAKERLKGEVIKDIFSYGKYLNFQMEDFALRIHFMLFGSYRIDEEREGMPVRLQLKIKGHMANFYNCSVQLHETPRIKAQYDFRTDIMSPKWDTEHVLSLMQDAQEETVDDVLMDQGIFTGVGNIIKNEVLFRLKMSPSTVLGSLSKKRQQELALDAREYSKLFYKWKKKYVLRKHYQIYRKGACPICGTKVVHEKTGKRERMSHYCPVCQAG